MPAVTRPRLGILYWLAVLVVIPLATFAGFMTGAYGLSRLLWVGPFGAGVVVLVACTAALAWLPRLRALAPRRRRQAVVVGGAIAFLAAWAWGFALLYWWLAVACHGCLD